MTSVHSDQPINEQRKVIVVNGFHRTGSTKCFQTIQLILRHGGMAFASSASRLGAIDRLIDAHMRASEGPRFLVLKSHRWMPAEQDPNVIALFTMRNLADVATSLYEHRLRRSHQSPETDNIIACAELTTINDVNWQIFFSRYCLKSAAVQVVQYEDFYFDDIGYVRDLARRIGIELEASAEQLIAAEIAPAKNFERTNAMTEDYDPTTQFRRHHLSPTLGRPGAFVDRSLPKRLRTFIDEIPLLLEDELAPTFLTAVAQLRALDLATANEAEIVSRFGAVAKLAAQRLQLAGFERWQEENRCQSASDLFAVFADFIRALGLYADRRYLATQPWNQEAREHGAYALARLADVQTPDTLGPIERLPHAFSRGNPSFNALLLEAAWNFAAIVTRAIEQIEA